MFIYVLVAILLLSQFAYGSSNMSSDDQVRDHNRLSIIIRNISFICYTPTQLDPNPNYQKIPTNESIRDDLVLLRPYFNGLVTYGMNDGMEQIPKIAEELKFQAIILGIWDIKLQTEINKAIQLAKEYPDLIFAICCGNEGLLTNRYDLQTLKNAMNKIHQILPSVYVVTSEPIHSYSDPELKELGDFCFPIIHPVFSGIDQSDPAAAVQWVIDRVDTLRSSANRPILIKETGLPSSGGQEFSPGRQATFWNTLFSKRNNISNTGYVAFEAFDLPWKLRDTGSEIEAHWGFWNANRNPKPVVGILKKL